MELAIPATVNHHCPSVVVDKPPQLANQTLTFLQSNSEMWKKCHWSRLQVNRREEVVVYLIVSISILHILFVARSNAIADDLSRQQQQEIVDNFQDVIRFQRDRFNGL